jgi:hypothetical protein
MFCVVRYTYPRRADHSSRVLPTVMCHCMWYRNLKNEAALACVGLLRQREKNKKRVELLHISNKKDSYVLKLSRRQKSITFSRTDSRVRRFIKSDVSDNDSVPSIRVETGMESVSETSDFMWRSCVPEKTSLRRTLFYIWNWSTAESLHSRLGLRLHSWMFSSWHFSSTCFSGV